VYCGSLSSLRRFSILNNYFKPSILGKRVIVEPLHVTTGLQNVTCNLLNMFAVHAVLSSPQEDHHDSETIQGSHHKEIVHQKCSKGPKHKKIKDCVIIANTTQLEMIDDDVEAMSLRMLVDMMRIALKLEIDHTVFLLLSI